MSSIVAGTRVTPRPNRLAREQAEQSVLRQRARLMRRGGDQIGRQFVKQRRPVAFGPADDLVGRALAADVVVGRDRGQDRDAHPFGEGGRFPRAVVLVDDQPADADIAAQLAEIFDRRADIVGDVERLKVVGGDDDHLLAHVARDRQAEPAAHDVAEKVEQHVVEAPVVEAELFEQLEAMDDAASAAAAPDVGAAQLHGVDAVALEADIADGDLLARQLLTRRGLDDRRAGAAAKQQRRRVALGIAADQQHFLAAARHHVGQVGEREALADAALAIDRDDLRLLLGGRRLGHQMGGRIRQFVGGQEAGVAHEASLQSSTILRQSASPKACS